MTNKDLSAGVSLPLGVVAARDHVNNSVNGFLCIQILCDRVLCHESDITDKDQLKSDQVFLSKLFGRG